MKKKHPKLSVERTGVDHLLEGTAGLLALVPAVYLLLNWGALPEAVPAHIGPDGLVDRWGSKGELVILPIVVLLDFILLAVMQRFPHTYNYLVRITEENAPVQYRIAVSMMGWMNLILSAGLSALFFSMVELAVQGSDRMAAWMMPVFMGSLFGCLWYFLAKSWRER